MDTSRKTVEASGAFVDRTVGMERIPWIGAAGGGLIAFFAIRAALRSRRRYDLAGRSFLITGGTRGLGFLVARELVLRDANVAICANDDEELDRAADALGALGGRVLASRCDPSDPRQASWLVDRVRRHFGGIDVVVNTAGELSLGGFDVTTDGDFRRAMDVHLWSALHVIRAALPDLRARGGRVVNVGPIGGRENAPNLLPYATSKAALEAFSRGLRAELRPEGVRVTTVRPGFVRVGGPGGRFFVGRPRDEQGWTERLTKAPLLSTSALRAARRIVEGIERGRNQVVIGRPGRLFMRLYRRRPGVVYDAFAVANRALPEAFFRERREAAPPPPERPRRPPPPPAL